MDLNEACLLIGNEINKEVEVVKRFLGGMSNYTYLIKVDGELFTYRIPGKNSEVFIDREVEFSNTKLVEVLELNCNNIYFNVKNGHKMAKFIDGSDLTNSSVDFDAISIGLRKLHNSKIRAVNDYNRIQRLDRYESLLKTKNCTEYILLKKELIDLLDKYSNVELVFCHGDAQKANWIVSNKMYLLDWEYAGNNDPYYDIACFGNVDFEDAKTLLKHYLNRDYTIDELNRLIVNRMFQCLQWYNVALYKEAIGLSKELKVDFKSISQKYLKLAKEFSEMVNNR